MKKIILASTSTVYGSGYLAYLLSDLKVLFENVDTILFIPFARPSGKTYDEYTAIARKAFSKIGKKVVGIHEFKDGKSAIKQAKGIFTGGGNSFELLKQLYERDLLEILKETIENGVPYLGTSAGSNICGQTIKTSNDMPIVYPPSFDAMGLVPFNINPHYLDADPKSTHMGETRETRINEYLVYNDVPVIGLREGSWLNISDQKIELCGKYKARWFEKDKEPKEISDFR